jgi:hypothetical protein
MVVRIGTSGWNYDHWEGVLYPHQLPPRKELDRYIQQYQTVEVIATTTAEINSKTETTKGEEREGRTKRIEQIVRCSGIMRVSLSRVVFPFSIKSPSMYPVLCVLEPYGSFSPQHPASSLSTR